MAETKSVVFCSCSQAQGKKIDVTVSKGINSANPKKKLIQSD